MLGLPKMVLGELPGYDDREVGELGEGEIGFQVA
jgi:hypothetical protein